MSTRKGLTSTKKFQFFDIVEGQEFMNPSTASTITIDDAQNNQDYPEIDLYRCTPDQMFAINENVFICGKVGHKDEQNRLVREGLILKIVNNKVIDYYRLFNKIYFNFQIKTLDDRPYFVAIGGDFNMHTIDGEEQYFCLTSIKFFDISDILKDPLLRKDSKGAVKTPKLVKQIILLKDTNKNNFYFKTDIKKGMESVQNINSFAINESFTKMAVGLDKGQVLLITCKNNFINVKNFEKEISIRYLNQDEEEMHITNLAFSLYEEIEILYATTAKAIYYISLDSVTGAGVFEELPSPFADSGAYSGCLAVDTETNSLLIASSANQQDFVIEYINLEKGPSWFFEGKKNNVGYFKNYFMFVIQEDKKASIAVFDKQNKFFSYYNDSFSRILALCSDENYIYAFINGEEYTKKNYIIKLSEKDNKEKFDTFYKKHFFDVAYEYAKNLGYDKKKISEISKRHAEFAYKSKEYGKAIEQYKKTINYLDPSSVIQKFLEKSKLDFLIDYLEELEKNESFKARDPEELKDYTALLLNCYIMQEKFNKLKEFVDSKDKDFPIQDVTTAIEVCLESQNTDLALNIAKKNNLNEEYLRILISEQGRFQEALDFIKDESDVKKRFDLLCNFGEQFLKESMKEKGDKKYADEIIKMVEDIIKYKERNAKKKKELTDIQNDSLLNIFIGYDDYYEMILDSIMKLDLECDSSILNRRIEMYLDKNNQEEREKIIELLDKHKDKLDRNYLWILFKIKDFRDGLIKLCEIGGLKSELFEIYMDTKQFDDIISLCTTENKDDLWVEALRYFVEKNKAKNADHEKIESYIEKILGEISKISTISPIQLLEILKSNESSTIQTFEPIFNMTYTSGKGYEKDKKEMEETYSKIEKVKEEMKDLKTKYTMIRPNKCAICNGSLSLPAVHFLCQHSFHILCLNANLNDDMKKSDCPLCKTKIDSVRQKIRVGVEFAENLKYEDIIKEENEKNKGRKFDTVIDLYSKGIIMQQNNFLKK